MPPSPRRLSCATALSRPRARRERVTRRSRWRAHHGAGAPCRRGPRTAVNPMAPPPAAAAAASGSAATVTDPNKIRHEWYQTARTSPSPSSPAMSCGGVKVDFAEAEVDVEIGWRAGPSTCSIWPSSTRSSPPTAVQHRHEQGRFAEEAHARQGEPGGPGEADVLATPMTEVDESMRTASKKAYRVEQGLGRDRRRPEEEGGGGSRGRGVPQQALPRHPRARGRGDAPGHEQVVPDVGRHRAVDQLGGSCRRTTRRTATRASLICPPAKSGRSEAERTTPSAELAYPRATWWPRPSGSQLLRFIDECAWA